jgi:phosphatidylinositol alpha-1,6-mannosyltransferase
MARILYVAQTFHPTIGGAERYMDRLAQHMSERGHEVVLMAPPTDAEELDRDYEVVRTDFYEHRKRGISYYLRARPMAAVIRRLAKQRSIDVVHFQYINPFATPIPLLPRRARLFATIHGSGVHFMQDDWLGKRLLRFSLKRLDGVMPVSDYCGELALKNGAPVEKVHVIYNGTDPELFSPLPLEVEPESVLTVGRLVPRKDIPTLMKALELVMEKVPKASLTVVGDGPERERLVGLAERMGLSDRVRFTTFVPEEELRSLYRRSGVFVLPARYDPKGKDIEGFGIVLLEAMASGRPVIGAKVGGIPSAIRESWGRLYTPENAKELAAHLKALLAEPGLANEMGMSGRRAVEEIYNWTYIAERMEDIYER